MICVLASAEFAKDKCQSRNGCTDRETGTDRETDPNRTNSLARSSDSSKHLFFYQVFCLRKALFRLVLENLPESAITQSRTCYIGGFGSRWVRKP